MTVKTGGMTHNVIMEDGQFLACAVDVQTAERITKALNGPTPAPALLADAAQAAQQWRAVRIELTELKAKLEALANDMENEADATVPDYWLTALRALL